MSRKKQEIKEDSSSEYKMTTRKKVKQSQDESLRENLIDDDSDSESQTRTRTRRGTEKTNKIQKKDFNLTTAAEEEAVDVNDDECYLCEEGGQILCCDNCYRSFHMECIKLKEEPVGDWFCKYCQNLKDSNADICPNSKKSLKNVPNHLKATCSKCLRNVHLNALSAPINLTLDVLVNKYFCFSTKIVKEFKRGFLKNNLSTEEALSELYKKHPYDYIFTICDKCIKSFGFAKIKNFSKQTITEDEAQDYYLLKLKRCSDIHQVWVTTEKLKEHNPALLRHYRRNVEGDDDDEDGAGEGDDLLEDSESLAIEKILACKKPIAARKKNIGQIYEELTNMNGRPKSLFNNYKFLIKWEDLEYKFTSWEDQFFVSKFKDKLIRYFDYRVNFGSKNQKKPNDNIKPQKWNEHPDYFNGKLFDYQLEGVNWLANQYILKNNAILADEMGLGKTIQTLCLIQYIYHIHNNPGPFLIVAPTSTIYNWFREAGKWVPHLETIVYMGDSTSRSKILSYEFFNQRNKKGLKPKFNIAITSYTFINQDVYKLKKIKWEAIVVDEAQRLKNAESKLYKLCGELDTNFKLLLTGTPIQNSVEELVNLVKYIMPNKPKLLEEIDDLTASIQVKGGAASKKSEVSEEEKEASLKRLRSILKKHMLRRTVQDADLKFPELEEKIVKVNLSNVQKNIYKNVLLKNYNVLSNAEVIFGKSHSKGSKRGHENLRVSLINILMHLRLICDHPDLFYSKTVSGAQDIEQGKFEKEFIMSSNKLRFLDKAIPKLLERGHKILIFTQFVLMLDIIEEFLSFRKLEFERLDGTTRNQDRQHIIDNFENGKSKIFILSTRAGGLGINLTSSDTVIFVDSDFNPYRDIQAFCRAYRIGQKNKVMVYRLVSNHTVEEKIVENATKKLMLGEMIINPIDQSKSDKGAVESILRYGAKELFEKTYNQDEEEDEIVQDKLEELLNRENTNGGGNSDQQQQQQKKKSELKINDLNNFYLSGFNLTDFSFAPIIQSNAMEETKENKYWETIMSKEHDELLRNKEEDLGKGKRSKRYPAGQSRPNLNESSETSSGGSDSEFEVIGDTKKRIMRPEYSSEDEEEKGEKYKDAPLPEQLQTYFNQLGTVYEELKGKSSEELTRLCRFEEIQRMKFLEFTLKHGITPFRIEDVYRNFIVFMEPYQNYIRLPEAYDFKTYLKYFYAALYQDNIVNDTSQHFFFKVQQFKIRQRLLSLLHLKSKVSYYKGKAEKFKIKSKNWHNILRSRQGEKYDIAWSNIDDYYLSEGICKHGMDEWDKIIRDAELWYKTEDDRKFLGQDHLSYLFIKIEDEEAPENKDDEIRDFVREYLKIRAHLLLDFMLQEKEKKGKSERLPKENKGKDKDDITVESVDKE